MPRVKAAKTNPSESPKRIIVSQTSACGGDVPNNNTRCSIRKKDRKVRPGSYMYYIYILFVLQLYYYIYFLLILLINFIIDK